MPGFILRNEIVRDELVKFTYPIDDTSTLETDELLIGVDLVMDAMLFFKEAVDLPVRVDTVDGTVGALGQFAFLLADNTGRIVARGTATPGDELVRFHNDQQVLVGLMVLNVDTLARFSGTVTGRIFHLLSETAVFCPDVVHVSRAPHVRYLQFGNEAMTGTVRIVARHGCRWVVDGGIARLDVFADYPGADGGQMGVRSVNGVVNRSIWLAHHPELNMRVDSRRSQITFTHVRDET